MDTLTPRERQIIAFVHAHGASNKEVGRSFDISEETVKRHLSNIFDKLGVSTRLELVMAWDHLQRRETISLEEHAKEVEELLSQINGLQSKIALLERKMVHKDRALEGLQRGRADNAPISPIHTKSKGLYVIQ